MIPFSLILILLPCVFSLVLLLSNNKVCRHLFLLATTLEFLLTCLILTRFAPEPESQFYFTHVWLSFFHVSFTVAIDGINILFVVLTNLVMLLVSFTLLNYRYPKYLYSLLLLTQMGLLGVFMSLNALLFYLFWEIALIPMYFVISYWGSGAQRAKVSFRFFFYTMFGSLLMLLAILYIGTHTDFNSFDIVSFYQNTLSPGQQKIIFWLFFVSFAIKIPIFPFHTWQRDTYVTAPFFATIILSALMIKMGLYGAIRWVLPVVPQAVSSYATLMLVLGLINILYGGIVAMRRKNIKAVLAYSSFSHAGLIFIGIFLATEASLAGTLVQSFNHGLIVTALFMIAEIIFKRYQSLNLSRLPGGLMSVSKPLAATFLIALLSSIALPLTGGFPAEFVLLNSLFANNILFASLAVLSIIFGAVYMLRMFNTTMLGPYDSSQIFRRLNLMELLPLIFIAALTLAIGLYPNLLFRSVEPSVKNLLYFIKFIKE